MYRQEPSGADQSARDEPNGLDVCRTALDWAHERDYAGYDPYDGLNSPLGRLATGWLSRLVLTHAVHKAPVNVRPLLGVPRERNPMGIGLFASTYLDLYDSTDDEACRERAESLLGWLRSNQSPAFDRPSWGYNFGWQNARKFYLPPYHPCVVVTVFCARAFLAHYRSTGDKTSLATARDAMRFLAEHVNTLTVDGHDVYSYTPYDSFVVVNANALAADLTYQVARATGDTGLERRAEALFAFLIDVQTDDGAWYYSAPAAESHLTHDNFHTGFVLESLHDYARDRGGPAEAAYEWGMSFYRDRLFEADGAPKFDHETRYPRDVHASAQGIITFSQSDDQDNRALARRVLQWTLDTLYDEEGYFYRRVGRVLTDRTPYMRWSQAWMCRALARYHRSR
jgi:hypothetical protein